MTSANNSIEKLSERITYLEEIIHTQSAYLESLSERIGETFTKQAYSVSDLMIRWNCKETLVRRIITNHKLKLLRGSNGQPRKPIVVLRSSVLDYENGNTLLRKNKRKTKPVPTWEEEPFQEAPKLNIPLSARRVRKLGEL